MACGVSGRLPAQDEIQGRDNTNQRSLPISVDSQGKKGQRLRATIHWEGVQLRDALGRLRGLFEDPVFVDRRIDPSRRVSLDIDAGSAQEVLSAIAAERELGVARLGGVVYLGPASAAEQLRGVAAARSKEIARLPAELRAGLVRKYRTTWPRLTQPRTVAVSIIEQRGWRLANPEKIPHDLWSAGELPDLSLADQLTLLLIGFDLTFALRPNERLIEIVSLPESNVQATVGKGSQRSAVTGKAAGPKQGARKVYTLRVQEQPVRAILQALSKRLHWAIQIDEEPIKAAGKSLDKRVSFSVENADQEQLLKAILEPAGLDYQLDDERVRIIAGRYAEK
jgi:hypothetical protein